jgi:hypothetical protein
VLVPKSQLTDTMYCPLPNNQFKLLYQVEVAPSTYRLNSTNPGQFYFNAFYYGQPGNPFVMTIQVPYPFVTQEGAGVPIQVHDNTATTSAGCYNPSPMLSGYTITTQAMTPTSSAGNQIITREDYTTKQIGQTTTVTVSGKIPATGIVYVTIHLDYGLKSTSSWKLGTARLDPRVPPVDTSSRYDANNAAGFGSGPFTILGYQPYSFSRTVGSDSAVANPYSFNEFKKFAGFMGWVTEIKANGGDPILGAKIEIYDPRNLKIGTVFTDADGFWSFPYKHTSRSATYSIRLIAGSIEGIPYLGMNKSVTIKANGFGVVSFELSINLPW